tara:strand:- start:208 stop:477 length:270 start_codon:yes stop_codon:yes gene_type:complete
MKKYICTALIKYSKEEVELHINALKIALRVPPNWRGMKEKGRLTRPPYQALLKDMERIKNEMLYKEEDAMADRLEETDLTVERSVIKNV